MRGLALNGKRTRTFSWKKGSKREYVLWIVGRRRGGENTSGEPSLGEAGKVIPTDDD